ncbi:hypothetical protein I7X12_18700 [Halosimplex litoreum]|uniref:DUF835 domain-containing protein n=1 Tax=Halosimplex litoreum TaxID=1198301 RepID=A0A7T3KVD8_9EURY|nr:hypothetical protein [Halosimplex litoreum]QPV62730.1 hypothetical protein I7X12_18700 [Halosimplex litoreum]
MTEGVRRATQGERASDGGASDARTGRDGSVALVYERAFTANAASQLDRALDVGAERSVLAILYRHDVRSWTTALRSHCDRVDSAAAVAVGPTSAGCGRDDAAVRTVSDPTDLTGVGIAVGEWLRARDTDEEPVVCLDSLSTLLQYADPERAFRFLHGLRTQVRSADATAFVSVDPGAHDEATLGTFRALFDAVVTGESATAETDDGESATADGRPVATDGGASEAPDGPVSGSE